MATLSTAELEKLIRGGSDTAGLDVRVIDIEEGVVTLRLSYAKFMARPGGNIGGPVIMGLADAAIYAAILAEVGPEVMAMTTSLNCNFLGRAFECELTATARLLKLGKRLAVAEVAISDSDGNMVAHATGTYSLPPKKQTGASAAGVDEQFSESSRASVDRGLAAALGVPAAAGEVPMAADAQDAPVIEVSENEYEELSTSDLMALMSAGDEKA